MPSAKRAKLNSGDHKTSKKQESSDSAHDDSASDEDADKMDVDKPKESGSALDWLKGKARATKDIEKLLEADEDSKSSGERSTKPKSASPTSSEASSEEGDLDDASEENSPKQPTIAAVPETAASRYQQAGTMEDLAQAGRIFVRNLSYSTTEEDLYRLFSQHGQISTVHLTLDKSTKQSKGFGFVQFLIPAQAVKAFGELDAKIFQGRLLHLIPAKPPPQKGSALFPCCIRVPDVS